MIQKDNNLKYVVEKLREAGVISPRTIEGGKQTIYKWIYKGILELRKKPHNDYLVANDDEIKDIIKEFSWGGNGRWSYVKFWKIKI